MNIQRINNAQLLYRALWRCIQSGEGDGNLADHLRDQLDTIWKDCSQEERNLLDKFCIEMRDYNAMGVAISLANKRNQYLAKLRVGQSDTWKCDRRTEDLFVIQNWLIDELKQILPKDDDRLQMQRFFNRKASGTEDLYQLAANVMTDALQGRIDGYRGRG
jgi:hypothetical protein